MTRHPDLDPSSIDALRDSLGLQPPTANGETPVDEHPAAVAAAPSRTDRLRERVKVRARPAADAVLERIAARVLQHIRGPLGDELRADVGMQG